MSPKKAAGVRKARSRPIAPPPANAKGGKSLVCSDCGFIAKHVMGLGRHRSARHGALSLRAQREAVAPKKTSRPTGRAQLPARSAPSSGAAAPDDMRAMLGRLDALADGLEGLAKLVRGGRRRGA